MGKWKTVYEEYQELCVCVCVDVCVCACTQTRPFMRSCERLNERACAHVYVRSLFACLLHKIIYLVACQLLYTSSHID